MHRPTERSRSEAPAKPRAGDLAGYVARNAPAAYRFAVLVLGSPVVAQDVVHDALMAAWQAGSEWPPRAIDGAFGRRLVGECRTALRSPAVFLLDAAPGAGSTNERLEAALRELDPNDQLVLAERLAMPGQIESVATTLHGRGSLDRRLGGILQTLGRRLGDEPAEEASLRAALVALYRWRDPGAEAPSQLRWRIQRSVIEAEQAASEQAEITANSGWGFAFKSIAAILLLVLAVTVVSVSRLHDDAAASASIGAGPAWPLSIAGIHVLQGGLDAPSVHVAATKSSLFATYQSSPEWRISDRQCGADVVGIVRPGGAGVEWLGQQAGHVEAVAGDPVSASIFLAGPGPYCEAAGHTSADGGRSWADGTLPGTASPSWVAFDPSQSGHAVAQYGDRLFASANGGRTWKAGSTGVLPLGFDADGRLVGWQAGQLVDSHDDGASWLVIGAGPQDAPAAGAATSGGVFLVASGGLWWYPLDAPPRLLRAGRLFSVATLGDGGVALGADDQGHPWIATLAPNAATPVALPDDVGGLVVTGGAVAVNGQGAAFALVGPRSAVAFAPFVP